MSYVGQGAARDNFTWDGSRHLWVPSPAYMWWGATQLNSITVGGYFQSGQRAAVASATSDVATFGVIGPAVITEIAAAVRVATHPVDVTYILELNGVATALTLTVATGVMSGVATGSISVPAGFNTVRMMFNASAANTTVRRYINYARIEDLAA